MRRIPAYLITFIFLLGLLLVDLSIILQHDRLKDRLDRALKENLKADVDYAGLSLESLKHLRFTAVVHDVQLYLEKDHDKSDPFVSCERLEVILDWGSLLKGRPEVNRVLLVRPRMVLTWTASGELDLPSVVAPSDTKARAVSIPPISVEGMTIVARGAPFLDAAMEVNVGGIDIALEPRRSKTFPYAVSGTVDDPRWGSFQIEGDFGTQALRGVIRRKGLAVTPAMLEVMAPDVREVVEAVDIKGSFDVAVELLSADYHNDVDITAMAEARGVSVSHKELPTKIENMNGVIELRDNRLVTTALDFELAHGHVRVERGEVDFGKPDLEFKVQGKAIQIDLNPKTIEEFARYPEPGPTIYDALIANGVDGTIDVEFDLWKSERDDRVLVDIQTTFREANLCYIGFVGDDGEREGFPYPIDQVVGSVRILNDQLIFRDIRSLVRLPDISASGTVTYGRKGFSMNIDIQGNSLRLDDKVRSCLSTKNQEAWDAYQPDGPASFDLNIKRANADDATTKIDLVVTLQGASAFPKLFPYVLEDIEGRLIFGEGSATRIDGMTARHGPTMVSIDGEIDLSEEALDPTYKLTIDARDAYVDQALLNGVRASFPDIAAEIERFNFKGAIDFKCRIADEATDAAGDGPGRPGARGTDWNTFDIKLKDLSFTYDALPGIDFRDLRGELKAADGVLSIESCTMTWRGNVFSASGAVNFGALEHDVVVRSSEVALDDATLEAAEAVFPVIGDIAEIVDLSGAIGVKVAFRKDRRGAEQRVNVTAQGVSIRGRDVPFLIEDVFGDVEVLDSHMAFKAWTGTVPYGADDAGTQDERVLITVKSGTYVVYRGRKVFDFSDIGVQNVAFSPRLIAMFPPEVRDAVEGLDLRGNVDARIDKFILRDSDPALSGVLDFKFVSMNPGVSVEIPRGSVEFEGATTKRGAFEIGGQMKQSSVRLGAFTLNDLSANYELKDGGLEIRKIRAGALDGSITPETTALRLDFRGPARFEAVLSLINGRLSKLIEELGGNPGRLDGAFSVNGRLEGEFSNQATWTGAAQGDAVGKGLYAMPFLADILRIVNFEIVTMPDNMQNARLECRIGGEEINFHRAEFLGPGLNLKGKGKIGFDGLCDLNFDLEVIKWLDSIPIIGDLVSLGRGLLWKSVRVQGPIEDPTASVQNYISELLPSRPDSGRRVKLKPLKSGDADGGSEKSGEKR